MNHANEIGLTSENSNEFLKHHVNIDISPARMPERARQRPDDFHPEILPKFHGRFVGRDDEIKLHRAKSEPTRFIQTMFAQYATNPLPARASRNNECGVRDMRAGGRLIAMQSVTANDLILILSDKNVRVVFEPIRERILARNVRLNWIRVAVRNHFPKNFPDRIAIRIFRAADFYFH